MGPNIFSGDVWMSRELPCRERETISHQTGASESHRLKKVPAGRGYVSSQEGILFVCSVGDFVYFL